MLGGLNGLNGKENWKLVLVNYSPKLISNTGKTPTTSTSNIIEQASYWKYNIDTW